MTSEAPTIRSFVRRAGRLTRAQRRALEAHWDTYGLACDGPLDLDRVFGRRAPRTLEIGFGMGDSLAAMAAADPERDFLGVEVYPPGIGSLLARIAALGLSNVRLARCDAVEVLDRCLAPASLDEVWLFFPDPWPKKRHHKRRLVQAPFVSRVHRVLKPGGRFALATDWEDYAHQMLHVLEEAVGFRNLAGPGRFAPRPAARPETKFERRGARLGHRVWDLAFEREGM